jgi:threonyl-tRNA synthetase
VVSPNIYNFDLWRTSGHADHYRDNMFSFDVEKAEYGLKPMNCPGHCVMFASRARSYRSVCVCVCGCGCGWGVGVGSGVRVADSEAAAQLGR